MNETTVNFQAKFNKKQEAVVSAFAKAGYTVLWSPNGVPMINREKKEIYIPVVSSDDESDVSRTVRGWVDHEMAHEIFQSDSDLLKKACDKSKSFEMIFRFVEDGRIERLMSEILLGCKENLEYGFSEIFKKKDSKDLGISIFVLAKYGEEGIKERGLSNFIEGISDNTRKEAFDAKTCKDSFDVSVKIYEELKMKETEEMKKMMKDVIDKSKTEKSDKEGEGKGDGKGEKRKSDDKGKSSGSKKTKSSDSGDSSDGDMPSDCDNDEDKESEGKKDKKSEKSEKSEKDKRKSEDSVDGEETEEKVPEKDKGDSKKEDESDIDGDSEDAEKEEKIEDERMETEEEILDRIKKAVEEQLKKEMGSSDISDKIVKEMSKDMKVTDKKMSKSEKYIPFTKYDKVYDLCRMSDAEKRESGITKKGYINDGMLRDLFKDVNVLAQKIKLEMISSSLMRNRYMDRGILDGRRIHMLGSMTSGSVFMRRVKKESLNTAVSLLIDSSGSMDGEKIILAAKIGFLLAQTMEILDIPNEILSFTQGINFVGKEDISGYSRYYPLKHYVHKSFDAKIRNCLNSMFEIGSSVLENADGESVMWAASRLVDRREKRKILFVISDGYPANHESRSSDLNDDLKKTVDMVSKAGIECIGIGVMTDSVGRFYKNHVIINRINEVVSSAYDLIAKSIRGAQSEVVSAR